MTASKKCQNCEHWRYTKTLGSPDVPELHCRFGFSPSKDCQSMALYNVECIRKYYREHPNELQLQFKFKN